MRSILLWFDSCFSCSRCTVATFGVPESVATVEAPVGAAAASADRLFISEESLTIHLLGQAQPQDQDQVPVADDARNGGCCRHLLLLLLLAVPIYIVIKITTFEVLALQYGGVCLTAVHRSEDITSPFVCDVVIVEAGCCCDSGEDDVDDVVVLEMPVPNAWRSMIVGSNMCVKLDAVVDVSSRCSKSKAEVVH
uniref:Uncharacterized protein n=1 Tax=Anopheles atroparvus TaxID=41427 RepID=A0A182IZ59_ANOAO